MDESTLFKSIDVSDELVELVKPELLPGERLLWVTKSQPGRWNRWGGVLVFVPWIIASLLVAGAALAAFDGQFGSRLLKIEGFLAVVGILSGLVFIVCTISMISVLGPALIQRKRDRTSTYAFTDHRAILWRASSETKGVEVHSYPRGSIKNISRVEYPDGSGDVNFSMAEQSPYNVPNTLTAVPDVRRVEHFFRQYLMVDMSQPIE